MRLPGRQDLYGTGSLSLMSSRGVCHIENIVTVKWLKNAGTNTRCPFYREYSYSKMTEKWRGPTPGVHLSEVSDLKRCPLRERVDCNILISIFIIDLHRSHYKNSKGNESYIYRLHCSSSNNNSPGFPDNACKMHSWV